MADPKASPEAQFEDLPYEMFRPRLDFIYRLNCEMSGANDAVGSPFDAAHTRIVLPIRGGTVKGPAINGIIQPNSGADWATKIDGTNCTRLDARYTLKTDDEHYIYVQTKGIFSPKQADSFRQGQPSTLTQSDVDWFTRLEFEAGSGPYACMNGVFAIGVLSMHEKHIIIDAYRVTNFDEPARVISKI